MEYIQSIVLGIIQGLTEFLPVSSSGHLVLFQQLFGLKEGNLTLDTMLHLGTLIAVFVVFWGDIVAVIKKPFGKMGILIIAGTIPTAIIGLGLKDFFDQIFESDPFIGIEFIITGLIIWWAETQNKGNKKLEEVSLLDAGIIGVLQGAAILPAISRSGLTIAGALFRGIEKETAARYSFMLSIPAILGAVVLQSRHILEDGMGTIQFLPILAGTLASAVFGYIAIKWMLQLIIRGKLKIFAYYVWLLGLAIIAAQLLGKY